MKELKTDILVVGAGLAGTLFALELAKKRGDLDILLLSKKEKRQSSSYLAQGGIAAVLPGAADSMKQHLADTLEASANSCNKEVAAFYIEKAPEAIQILEYWGTVFDSLSDGSRALALEGGHSTNRVLHHKDSTGKHIIEKLHASLPLFPNIKLLEDVQVLELQQPVFSGAVQGALGWDSIEDEAVALQANAVILATGGLGSLYSYSTNPPTATGEGVYLAAKSGAAVKDLAYIQFHPTALWKESGSQLSLISEAVRGAGAVLRNEHGERFMEGLHPLKELAPRDVVSRCISKEILHQQLPYVFLDATMIGKEEWKNHFPGIFNMCSEAGVDPSVDWIPVVPAAHYSCGGIVTSEKGDTSVENLFVIGETACTGLHGANRLASNSLLEATIMASKLALQISGQKYSKAIANKKAEWKIADYPEAEEAANYFLGEIRKIVTESCGIIKTKQKLQQAYDELLELKPKIRARNPKHSLQYQRLKMILKTSRLLIKSSMDQKENIGVFYNSDLVVQPVEVF